MSPFRNVLLLAALTVPISTAAQTVDSLETLNRALAAVASFEQGQASGQLSAIETFVFTLPVDSPLRGDVENELLDALANAKTADAKRFLCTQLRVAGTARCVPVVARLLADAEVAHMAVYCLGRMEFADAGNALRDALKQTSGNVQAGILNALADRRDPQIAGQCVELLAADTPAVAKAAARALGRLGTYDSIEPLKNARKDASPELRTEIDNALLCTAELLAAQGDKRAVELYREFAEATFTEPFRFAALRAVVLTADSQNAELLLKSIQSASVRERRYALSLIPLVEGSAATKRFASAISALDAEDQVILIRALGVRGDAAAAPDLAAATQIEDETVRVAALEALGTAGNAESLATLATAAASQQGLLQETARASLVNLPGNDVNAALARLSATGDASVRAEAITALAGRGITAATPALLEAAHDQDAKVRTAAINALGSLASPGDLPAMIALTVRPTAVEDRSPLADAIGKLFFRIEDPASRSKPVLAAYEGVSPEVQVALLPILAKSGSLEALAKVQSALSPGGDQSVCDAAVSALADWPNTAAVEALLEFLGTTTNSTHKEIALKGYVRLAESTDDPSAAYLQVLAHLSSVNDRKLVLEGLGLNADSPRALAVAMNYVDDRQLQATAGLAALRIAHRLRTSHEQLARETLHKVLAEVDHEDVRTRAQEVLNDLDKYEDHILQWVGAGPFTEEGKDGQAVFNTTFPPEQPEAKDVDWKPFTKGVHEWQVNLEEVYGGLDHCAAYVRTSVWSPIKQDVLFEMGSDDAVKLWVNGDLLSSQWKTSGAAPRQERVPAVLKEGWNGVMLKVADFNGGWEFGVRIRRPDGGKLEDLTIEAK